jgi:hypothetical protein
MIGAMRAALLVSTDLEQSSEGMMLAERIEIARDMDLMPAPGSLAFGERRPVGTALETGSCA